MLSGSFNRRYLLIFTIATAWAWWAGLGSAAKGQEIYQFTASWCKFCKQTQPAVDEAKRSGVVFRVIDVDKSKGFAQQFNAPPIPLFVAVDAKRVPQGELRGMQSSDALRKLWAKVKSAKTQVEKPPGSRSNFRVSGDFTQEYLQRVANACEEMRKNHAIFWLGYELPPWDAPCEVKLVKAAGNSGSTSYVFGTEGNRGPARQLSGTWRGTEEGILSDVVPHEVLHTVFASHFKQKVPRWCDEGAATLTESTRIRSFWRSQLDDSLHSSRGLPTSALWDMPEYPKDFKAFYAQSYSQVEFMVQSVGRQGFVKFVDDALAKNDWQSALKANFEYATQQEFQDSWIDWVKAGCPKSPGIVAVGYSMDQMRHVCWRWYPGKRWQQRRGILFHKPYQHGAPTQQPAAAATSVPEPEQSADGLAPIPDKPDAAIEPALVVPGPPAYVEVPGVPVTENQKTLDAMRTAFEARESELQAKFQADTKALRDQLAAKAGIPVDVQAQLDQQADDLEKALAEKLEQSNLATSLAKKAQDLEQKVADKVREVTGLNQTGAELRSKADKLAGDLETKGGLLTAAKAEVDKLLPQLESLKAGTGGLPWIAQGLIAITGLTPVAGVPLATALTVLSSLLLGRWSKGLNLKQLGADAVVSVATAGNPAPSPQAIAPPAAANGPDLVAAVKQVAQQVASNAPPAAATAAPSPAPAPAKVYSPVYALNPAAANELADKRLKTMGMTLGQQGLLAQLHQEANQALAQGGFAGKTGADLADAIEHWVLKRFISSHGVRTSLAPDPVLPGQAAV